jgi:hypothetical protein
MTHTNDDDFRTNVGEMPSTKLCEIIATFRYIGMLRNEAIISMGELSRRRALGDNFLFEEEIIKIIDGLPKLKKDLDSLFKVPLMGKLF